MIQKISGKTAILAVIATSVLTVISKPGCIDSALLTYLPEQLVAAAPILLTLVAAFSQKPGISKESIEREPTR